MSDESASPAEAGSETMPASMSLTEASRFDFDSGAEEANPTEESEQEAPSDDEHSEAEQGEEPDSSESSDGTASDEPEAEPEGQPAALDDAAVVTLKDGSQKSLQELKDGYFREKDYRQKTQELGNHRRDLEAKSERVSKVIDTLVEDLAKRLPDEPSPQLAVENAGEYVRQKALYDSAHTNLQRLFEKANEARGVVGELSGEQRTQVLTQENEKLVERLPDLKDPAKREEFNRKTLDTALQFGFSREEFGSSTDHRLMVLGHYARMGLDAEKAKQKAAQKVAAAPPVTPTARRSAGTGDAHARANKEAFSRLKKTGSMKDALKIDFA